MIQVEKIICSKCGKDSYDDNEFEFCVYCDAPMCDDCAEYEYNEKDGMPEPVCEKCQ